MGRPSPILLVLGAGTVATVGAFLWLGSDAGHLWWAAAGAFVLAIAMAYAAARQLENEQRLGATNPAPEAAPLANEPAASAECPALPDIAVMTPREPDNPSRFNW